MEKSIIIFTFFMLYFNISGLSTTNILRLTSGNNLSVLSSKCVCGNCGMQISPFYQLPIISYILCRGKCRNCKIKIPVDALILEISVLIGMFLISLFMSFSFTGVLFSFVYYEVVRVFLIVIKGKRSGHFVKQYLIAVIMMTPHLLVSLFAALVYKPICL